MKKRSAEELEHIASSWEMRDGVLVWKRQARRGKTVGDPVGLTTRKTGHLLCFLYFSGKNVGYSVGQIAWFLYTGKWPTAEVDHTDCNPQNNKRENLRLATRVEQCRNRIAGRAGRPNKGVYKRDYGDRWMAHIVENGRSKYLGTFSSEAEAVEARKLAASKLHGEFANTQSYEEIAA
jgi:hypothetical protein